MSLLKKLTLYTSLLSATCSSTLAGNPNTDVWPKPQKVENLASSDFSAKQLSAADVQKFPVLVEAFKKADLKPDGKIPLKVTTGKQGQAILEKSNIKLLSGAYVLQISKEKITIAALDETGVFYAMQTLAQMISTDGKLVSCLVKDWPDMPFRGTIEGFYGKPWEHERRLSQIRFYGRYKMNVYIYGPKDDPYSGFNSHKWREEYPAAQAKQIRELVKEAKKNHVNFVWALHPGSSIRWDDKDGDGIADDVIIAQKKLESMYKLGVRSFAVFFDDIGGEGAKAGMQAKMLNHLNREFIKKKKDVTPLLMCPTDYAGGHGSKYKKSLGTALDKDVDIMWTGPGICSDIPEKVVDEVSQHWQRKPFIWWNWPVNDYCRFNLLLGRTYGLDKGNIGKLSGFASNPMDKPEASKIGLFSIANWAWNTGSFDSQASWEASFPRLFPTLAEPMHVFAKHNSDQGKNYHGYRREESVAIKPEVDKLLSKYRSGEKLDAKDIETLGKEFNAIAAAAAEIIQKMPKSDPALWHEIEFWVRSFRELADAGAATLELAKGNASSAEEQMALFSKVARAQSFQQEYSAAQKQRHFEETFESDKKSVTGAKVSTLVLTPMVNEIYANEWKKFYLANGGKKIVQKPLYQAFSNAKGAKNFFADREGIYVKLRRVLEVIKLKPDEHIGLGLPEGVHARFIHIILDNDKAAKACIVEVSQDGKKWKRFNAAKSGKELRNPVKNQEKIRFFRMVNKSSSPIEFRIELFKFDVPANAKGNTVSSATDGDPTSFYAVKSRKTLTGPAKAKRAYILSDAPEGTLKQHGNILTISPAKSRSIKIFEILWK